MTLDIRCPRCRRNVEIPAASLSLPDPLDMDEVASRLRCTGCNRRGGMSVYPHHKGWVRYLRSTGQRHRLPWFAPMIRDIDDA